MIQIPLPTYWRERERERERYLKENVYPFGKEIHKKMFDNFFKIYENFISVIPS